MNLAHASSLLGKINRLFEDYSQDGNAFSTLEKDLLREYVRRFYEELSADQLTAAPTPVKEKSQPQNQVAAPRPEPIKESQPVARGLDLTQSLGFEFEPAQPEPVKARAAAIKEEPAPKPEEKPAPRIIEIPAAVEADLERVEAVQKPQVQAVPEAKSLVQATAVQPAPAKAQLTGTKLEPELRELFAQEKTSELSARLAGSKIPDLTKSLGLNEALQIKSELFSSQSDLYKQTLQQLNGLDTFDEAIQVLAPIARQHDWLDEERRDTARSFVKLVQRRYA